MDESSSRTVNSPVVFKAEGLSRVFSLAEVKSATRDFSDEHVIGRGGFGKVYKGLIDNGEQIVAIKRLDSTSKQGEHEFLTEIQTLTKLRHHNLVSLIGHCNENGEMILVYEYIPCGTLADHLFGSINKNSGSSLSWTERLSICIGAGRGLDYLHTGRSLIHRDVKTSNILLDHNFAAKVSDFGLAKHFSSTHVSTLVKGTFGYIDPDYFCTGRLTMNSDTYAFGVVLLETFTGRSVHNPGMGESDLGLIQWFQERNRKGKVREIVDPCLSREICDYSLKVFVRMVERCFHPEPKKRPKMAQVVLKLESALELHELSSKPKAVRLWRWDALLNKGRPAKTEDASKNEQCDPAILEDKPGSPYDVDSPGSPPAYSGGEPAEGTANTHPRAPSFTWTELTLITNNFSAASVIHEGPSSTTHYGVLETGQPVAVKKLVVDYYRHLDFHEQVSIAYNHPHPHLVKLIGYCVYNESQLLVYEYASHGSLAGILNPRGQGVKLEQQYPILTWDQRVKIAIEAAKGLEYIHLRQKVHHDIKSSNILIFDGYTSAKVADFCFPSEITESDDPLYYHPNAQRTPPCSPPELKLTGESSRRSDVYSFGVVLLELISGRKPYDSRQPIEECDLVCWAKPRLSKDKVRHLVDPRLRGAHPPKAVEKVGVI